MNSLEIIARKALANWNLAIETNNWAPYISLLTDDYTFWLPEGGFHYKTSDLLFSKKQLVDSEFNQKRLKAYKNAPDRISIGDSVVVFEFIYDANEGDSYFQNCMALSFDIQGYQIKACREYHCVLMKF